MEFLKFPILLSTKASSILLYNKAAFSVFSRDTVLQVYDLGIRMYLNIIFWPRVPVCQGVCRVEKIHWSYFQKRRFLNVLLHSSCHEGFCGPHGGFVLAIWKRLEKNVLILEIDHSSAELFELEQPQNNTVIPVKRITRTVLILIRWCLYLSVFLNSFLGDTRICEVFLTYKIKKQNPRQCGRST